MNRGRRREDVYRDDEDFLLFLNSLARNVEDVELESVCLLPDVEPLSSRGADAVKNRKIRDTPLIFIHSLTSD